MWIRQTAGGKKVSWEAASNLKHVNYVDYGQMRMVDLDLDLDGSKPRT